MDAFVVIISLLTVRLLFPLTILIILGTLLNKRQVKLIK
jgi:hypothetical protein